MYMYSEMESYEGSRDWSLEFASFCWILRRFRAFYVVLVSHLRRYQFRAILAAMSWYLWVVIYELISLRYDIWGNIFELRSIN